MDSILMGAAMGAEEAPVVQNDAENVDPKKDKKREEKKIRDTEMANAFKNRLATDPDFRGNIHRLKDSARVINTLGYGTEGNLVLDKNAPEEYDEEGKLKRKVKQTSYTVGYRVMNIGNEPIEYVTIAYALNDQTGKYEGKEVTKIWEPGTHIDLPRKYMSILFSRPEFSFQLENGIMMASSGYKTAKTVDDRLSNIYFRFNKAEDGSQIEVNDDEIKISIDDNGVVKPEFVEAFGDYNNSKERKPAKKAGRKWTTQDMLANMINMMVEESRSNGTL